MTHNFHVGYYDLHPSPGVNFQMNRWITYLGGSGLDDMRAIAPRLAGFESYRREFMALGDRALAEGRRLHAGYYYRSAEFFMWADDPAKQATRRRFLELVRGHYGIGESDRHAVPYEGVSLPAYRFTHERPKDTLVVFGGFDSYVEEFLPILLAVRDMGYDVICFEGPGQGTVLEECGLPMTPEWRRPVAAVLDYFGLDDVTLMGVSLGGCLVLRAAAYEPRVQRVIADDVCFSLYDIFTRRFTRARRALFSRLLDLGARGIVDGMLRRPMRQYLEVEWFIRQGMHVMGVRTPFEFFRRAREFTTADVSARVKQDVLLLAGSEDHGIAVDQFYRQIEALTAVRSLTARLFTRAEGAQAHCQVGNVGLSLDVITNWLEQIRARGR